MESQQQSKPRKLLHLLVTLFRGRSPLWREFSKVPPFDDYADVSPDRARVEKLKSISGLKVEVN
jgi:hypothetical protein